MMQLLMQVLGLEADPKGAALTNKGVARTDINSEASGQSIFSVEDVNVDGDGNTLVKLIALPDEIVDHAPTKIARDVDQPLQVGGFVQWVIQSEKLAQPQSQFAPQVQPAIVDPRDSTSQPQIIGPASVTETKLVNAVPEIIEPVASPLPKDGPLHMSQQLGKGGFETVTLEASGDANISTMRNVPALEMSIASVPQSTPPAQGDGGKTAALVGGAPNLLKVTRNPDALTKSIPKSRIATEQIFSEPDNPPVRVALAPATPKVTDDNKPSVSERKVTLEPKTRISAIDEKPTPPISQMDIDKKPEVSIKPIDKSIEVPIEISFRKDAKEASPRPIEALQPVQATRQQKAPQTPMQPAEVLAAAPQSQTVLSPKPEQTLTQLRQSVRERTPSLEAPELASQAPQHSSKTSVVQPISAPYVATPLAWMPREHGQNFASSFEPNALLTHASGPDFETRRAEQPKLEIPARPVVHQLAQVAKAAVGGTIEVRLSPEELGRVRLSLSPGDSNVTVHIFAERPETLDLLRRNVDLLAEGLRQEGFTDLSFSFGDTESEDAGDKGDEGKESASHVADVANSITAEPPSNRAVTQSGRLDLRL